MPLYVRVADDFLIFDDDKGRLHDLLMQLHEFLTRYRLKLYPRKCVVQRVADGAPFLGWRLFPTHRLLKRSAGVRFQRRLRGLCEAYADGLISWDEIRQVLASWNGHLAHGDTWGLRSHLFADQPFVRRKESER